MYPVSGIARAPLPLQGTMRKVDRYPLLLTLVVALSAAVVLAADVLTEPGRRLADVSRDLALAKQAIGGELAEAHNVIRQIGQNPRVRISALNRRTAYFQAQLDELRAHYPEVRAITADAGYGYSVPAGEPAVRDVLDEVQDSPLCVGGHVYTVMWAPLGNAGVLGVAYDTGPALARARAATEGRVRLSLLELLTLRSLVVDGFAPCSELPEDSVYVNVANGERAVRFVPGNGSAVGYAPLDGTILAVLVEEDPARQQEPLARRVAVIAVAALVPLAYVALRRRGSARG